MSSSTSSYIGSLPDHFSIDSDGGTNYVIPIEVPPGIAKMMPKLSAGYNSGGGNGLLGVGWRLLGLSAITRVKATPAQDGFHGTVNFDASDRFALDGQRLVPASGLSYNGVGVSYRTEIESWHKIVPQYGSGGAANGPQSRWYQAAMSPKAGRLRVADKTYDVTFEPAGDQVSDAIDAAYEAKYPGSTAVPIMQGDGPKSATVRIVPR